MINVIHPILNLFVICLNRGEKQQFNIFAYLQYKKIQHIMNCLEKSSFVINLLHYAGTWKNAFIVTTFLVAIYINYILLFPKKCFAHSLVFLTENVLIRCIYQTLSSNAVVACDHVTERHVIKPDGCDDFFILAR